jgi:hypothetical protein
MAMQTQIFERELRTRIQVKETSYSRAKLHLQEESRQRCRRKGITVANTINLSTFFVGRSHITQIYREVFLFRMVGIIENFLDSFERNL